MSNKATQGCSLREKGSRGRSVGRSLAGSPGSRTSKGPAATRTTITVNHTRGDRTIDSFGEIMSYEYYATHDYDDN